MNLSTVAMILLAWQLLYGGMGQPRPSNTQQLDLKDILSEDVKNVLNCAQKLSDDKCSQGDRAGAIFEIMSNPTLQNIASKLFNTTQNAAPPQQPEKNVNEEGYRFETPSDASQEFFRPIDNIADAEIKHKLYWFYDNWYTK